MAITTEPDQPSPPDTAPNFDGTVADQIYKMGDAVEVTLPKASGGDGPLSYSLQPTVPGLTFGMESRTLSGIPTAIGMYEMTYQVQDGDVNTSASDAATVAFTITVQPTEPPFAGTVSINPNVITDRDPTTFETLTYTGTETRLMFDRRTGVFSDTLAFLFDATFQDGLTIEMQINAEFGSREAAEAEATKYATYIGKLPTLLRANVETSWIHKGNESFGGGNRNILIHVDRAVEREIQNLLEEVLIHEAAHTSLDENHEQAPAWLSAQADDPTFISTYAREHPDREDIAESFLPYLLVRYRAERAPAALVDTINTTIPHRLEYFDLNVDGLWCPIVPEDCP